MSRGSNDILTTFAGISMVIADPAAIEEELQRVDHADQMEYGLPAQTLHPGCGFGSTTAGSKTMPRVHSFGSLLAEGVNALALTAKTEVRQGGWEKRLSSSYRIINASLCVALCCGSTLAEI